MQSPRARMGLDPGRAITLAGIAAAMFVAVMVNILAARHWKRWDWTTGKLYTLSPATTATLRDLPDTVELWVLLGSEDPLSQSVKQLLLAYRSESDKLDIHYVDPDRDAVELLEVRNRFHIEAGRAESGHVVTDAVMVVAHGERHWFLGPSDMIEVSEGDERAKPKEEQAITGAIRSVLAGEKARICFTAGHGELSIADGGATGLGFFKDVLEKDNYETAAVDTTELNAFEPFKGCTLVVIAGPRGTFTKEEEARLRTYLMTGGNLLACVSPIPGNGDSGLAPPGFADALRPFGIALDEDVVLEVDPKLKRPGDKTAFFVTAKAHAVTGALVAEGTREPPKIMIGFGAPDSRVLTRSMHQETAFGAAIPSTLLVTSDAAFGITSIAGGEQWPDEGPTKKPSDRAGPLVVGMASERPKLGATAPHGPRVVVLGTASTLLEANWQLPGPLHGAAFLTENSLSWLAARPVILDIPAKPSVTAGLHISEESQVDVRRYVLVYMPLAAILLGLAVALRRRSTEGRTPQRAPKGGAPEATDEGKT
jgi:hypothetical protein